MRKVLAFVVLACVCTLLGVSTLQADAVLLGDSHQSPYTSGTFVYFGGAAQQFHLNRSVLLTQINIGVASDSWLPDQIYLFQLSTRLGPDTSAEDVLMSFTTTNGFGIPSSLINPGQMPSYLSFPVPSVEIDPGTYYLTDALIVNHPPGDTGGSLWYGTAPLDSSIGSWGKPTASIRLIRAIQPLRYINHCRLARSTSNWSVIQFLSRHLGC